MKQGWQYMEPKRGNKMEKKEYKDRQFNTAVEYYHTNQLKEVFKDWKAKFELSPSGEFIKFKGSNGSIAFEAQGNIVCVSDIVYLYAWSFSHKGERLLYEQKVDFSDGLYDLDFVKKLHSDFITKKLDSVNTINKSIDELKSIKEKIYTEMVIDDDTDNNKLLFKALLQKYLKQMER